uniref:Uncharacterized protein n=1 Tax=Eutreptiella gymnastica TaxID=73025 RepID=A0A7S1N2C7_9EUGL|mmetsp:Transcript_108885/g.188424  ORF Transcript_108885/g.188424 Transcript_108885/m.188424 type:complete len:110 (+) Transcript_108885:251-580(+)
MLVHMKHHHLEDLVAPDGDWAHTKYTLTRWVAIKTQANQVAQWHQKHKDKLACHRNADPPAWQQVPRKWVIPEILTTEVDTVVGGREAKHEKTVTISQGPYTTSWKWMQ